MGRNLTLETSTAVVRVGMGLGDSNRGLEGIDFI